MKTYLEFEKPIADLERRVADLRYTASNGDLDIDADVERREG